MASITLNKISIGNKVNGALTKKRFVGLAERAANTRFVFAHKQMLKEFNEHGITKEIEAGAEATSSYLPKGNVVSFLGLPDGPDAIAQIRFKLTTEFDMNRTPSFSKSRNGITYSFKIEQPTLQEIYDGAESEWSNKSFIEQVQEGVSNFIYYLYSKSGRFAAWSVSGTGLQSRATVKSNKKGKVLGIKWINQIIKNFQSRFSK